MPLPEVRSILDDMKNRTNWTYSGAATTASRLGQPDLAIATMNDFVDAGRMHASINPSVPVIADADTGYASINPKLPSVTN